MRKITHKIYSLTFFLIALASSAQISTGGGAASILANVPTTNTNVGIGTNNPTAKLEVNGDILAKTVALNNSFPNGQVFSSGVDAASKCLTLSLGTYVEAGTNLRMFNFLDYPSSNTHPLPISVLDMEDRNAKTRFQFRMQTGGTTQFVMNNKVQEEMMKLFEDGSNNLYMQLGMPNSRVIIGGYSDYPNSLGHKLFVQNGSAKIEGNILTDANIGIGTSSFTDGATTYRLSVKGKVRAEEVKVYNTWADYVFNPDYALPSLNEVENYISKNGHLQNVPSAEEITQNGLELGEMAKIQQEKIEELTLYLIQQNKELTKQNSEIEELKAQIKLLLAQKK
ncbi:hypothetical protein [Pseudomonas shirazensis]